MHANRNSSESFHVVVFIQTSINHKQIIIEKWRLAIEKGFLGEKF
jgi:hypothetical protein